MQLERDIPTISLVKLPFFFYLGGVHGADRFFLLKVPIKLWWLCNFNQQTSHGLNGSAGYFQVPHWNEYGSH